MCGGCKVGYMGNQTAGCHPRKSCASLDFNPCDVNAHCVIERNGDVSCAVSCTRILGCAAQCNKLLLTHLYWYRVWKKEVKFLTKTTSVLIFSVEPPYSTNWNLNFSWWNTKLCIYVFCLWCEVQCRLGWQWTYMWKGHWHWWVPWPLSTLYGQWQAL